MIPLRNARYLSQSFLEGFVRPGDACVDATLGNGHDCLRLCQLVGEEGLVHGFDVQEQALQSSRQRLAQAGVLERAHLHLLSHAQMESVVQPGVRAVLFNLGWLPGGDHGVTTRTDSTLQAIHASLRLLQSGGRLLVCCYPGHAEGSRELEAVRALASALDVRRFNALFCEFVNQGAESPKLLVVDKA